MKNQLPGNGYQLPEIPLAYGPLPLVYTSCIHYHIIKFANYQISVYP